MISDNGRELDISLEELKDSQTEKDKKNKIESSRFFLGHSRLLTGIGFRPFTYRWESGVVKPDGRRMDLKNTSLQWLLPRPPEAGWKGTFIALRSSLRL